MSELIYRQAAINAINSWRGRFSEEYNEAIDDCENSIKELPIIQPETQWIPVSERLPEKGGEYLVSVHHTIGAISVFHPEKDTYVDDVAIMKYHGKFPSTVRAWIPLPKPFEGGTK